MVHITIIMSCSNSFHEELYALNFSWNGKHYAKDCVCDKLIDIEIGQKGSALHNGVPTTIFYFKTSSNGPWLSPSGLSMVPHKILCFNLNFKKNSAQLHSKFTSKQMAASVTCFIFIHVYCKN